MMITDNSSSSAIDIDLITQLLTEQPQIPAPRRTLFDIAGIRGREYSISQVIAFFMDPEEEHGFKYLFLNALLDLISTRLPQHGIDLTARITVATEWSTRNGRIDILVLGWTTDNSADRSELGPEADWAVIIENKIHASDDNDLMDYWTSVRAKKKMGILLALDDRTVTVSNQMPGYAFFAFTHERYLTHIKDNLGEYVLDAKHEHLLLLKEHISNIDGFYTMDKNNVHSEGYLKFYRSHTSEIDELDKLYKHLGRYIIEALEVIMLDHGFVKDRNSKEPTTRWFHPDPNGWDGNGQLLKDSFRLWVDVPAILRDGTLAVNLEMHGKATSHGQELRNLLTNDPSYIKDLGLKLGTNNAGGSYYHLAIIAYEPLDRQLPLEDAIRAILEQQLFNHQQNVVRDCFDKWVELHPKGL